MRVQASYINELLKIDLISATGQVVLSENHDFRQHLDLDLSQFSGLHFLRITTENGNQVVHLVVVNP